VQSASLINSSVTASYHPVSVAPDVSEETLQTGALFLGSSSQGHSLSHSTLTPSFPAKQLFE